jgi:hypothetical protein
MKTLFVLLVPVVLFACESHDRGPVDARESSGQGCSFAHTEQVPEPPPPALLDLVRACEADVRECEALCQTLIGTGDIIDTCMVEHAPTVHTVKITYHLLCAD